MPRYGQGKAMATQAARLLKQHLSYSSRHAAKQASGVKGSQSTGKIHSQATFNKYASSLKNAGEWAKTQYGIRYLKDLTAAQAQAYLEQRAAHGIGQKQLDADRNALEFVTGKGSLTRVSAETPREVSGRAYTPAQVERIMTHQSERNALSTRIAYESGLRAHELLTLRRADEVQPSGHRTWREERFRGREGVRYIVTGKGGLRREVQLTAATAQRLEARRLATPREVSDRQIRYQQHYDINGGNRWSKSFHAASKAALGWSTGAHGLRHRYAQERMAELQAQRVRYPEAREIVSQELGHFRGEVTETYLR